MANNNHSVTEGAGVYLRRLLLFLYRMSGVLAGVFLCAIAVLVISQIVGRMFHVQVRSAIDFATFCLAAFIFLGLAYTHRSGSHIRVTLLIRLLPTKPRRAIETLNVVAAAALFAYFTVKCAQMTLQSYEFGSVSIGVIPFPIFVPQLGMTLGLFLITAALVEDLVRILQAGTPSYLQSDPDS